jgi:hypothetical protein
MIGGTADSPAVENGCIMGFDGSQWNLMGARPVKWGYPWVKWANSGNVLALFHGLSRLNWGCG